MHTQRAALILVAAATVFAGCSDDGASDAVENSPPSANASTSRTTEAISDDCQLATKAWSRSAMRLTVAGQHSRTALDISEDHNVAVDEIAVYCPEGLADAVAEAEYDLALANAQLQVCDVNQPECKPKKIDRLLDSVRDVAMDPPPG